MPEFIITGWPAIVFAFICSVGVTWYSIPKVIRVVTLRQLTDKPGERKIHRKSIPTLGGVGIFGGFAFGLLMSVNGYIPGIAYFMAALLFLFFIGIKDDLVSLDPRKKFVAELSSVIIIVLFTNLRFTSLHGLFGVDTLPAWSSYLITIFVMLLIINAVNLIDGIDGLAASVGIIASLAFGTWFFLSGDYGYTVMASALTGALMVFLAYNLSDGPNKIFMGDTGSLVIGLTLAVFAIRFNEINATTRTFYDLASAPSVSIAVLIVPLFDTLRVIILRWKDRQSLFVADNRHIHHLMLRAGFTHRQATMWISLFNIGIIAVALLLDRIGILWLGLVLLLICTIFTQVVVLAVRRRERHTTGDEKLPGVGAAL